jgi:hypothetical protein
MKTGLCFLLTLLMVSCRADRITVLDGEAPVKDAKVYVYFDSSPNPYEATTDENGMAEFEIKHKELVVSLGIFTTDGRVISVLNAKKWPIEVKIGKQRRQVIK